MDPNWDFWFEKKPGNSAVSNVRRSFLSNEFANGSPEILKAI
jgi:hypothetical protein